MVFPGGFLWGGEITHGGAGLTVFVGVPHGLRHMVTLTTVTDMVLDVAAELPQGSRMPPWFLALNLDAVGFRGFYHVICHDQEEAEGTTITPHSTDTINKILCMLLLRLCHMLTLVQVGRRNMGAMNGVALA